MTQREKWLKLAQLANFLDDLPHDKFTMPRYSSRDATEHSCGTAGCAAGWAGTIFRTEGWTFAKYLNGERSSDRPYYPLWGGHLTPQNSFADFFGISYVDADDITSPASYGPYEHSVFSAARHLCPTPRETAAFIRKVLAKYDPSVLEERSKPATPAMVTA